MTFFDSDVSRARRVSQSILFLIMIIGTSVSDTRRARFGNGWSATISFVFVIVGNTTFFLNFEGILISYFAHESLPAVFVPARSAFWFSALLVWVPRQFHPSCRPALFQSFGPSRGRGTHFSATCRRTGLQGIARKINCNRVGEDFRMPAPRLRNFRWMRCSAGPVTSASKNSRMLTDFPRETRVPGAHGTNPTALLIGGQAFVDVIRFSDLKFHPALGPLAFEQIRPASALEGALPIREEVNDLALDGGGTDSRHPLKSAESRTTKKDSPKSKILQLFALRYSQVYATSVSVSDSRLCKDVSSVLGQRFDATEERKSVNSLRWGTEGRGAMVVMMVRVGFGLQRGVDESGLESDPKFKLRDKCCERTADVENTMCRVNGMGGNAGAWDAADRGGTLSDVLGYRFDAPHE
ncbi:hypothetical protein C8F04DRAFT_1237420 [Mycena alexandri]|uniref:Uncharacterized protein n=1 Tax=Mycena alexandri TaxID=1745969 RepID=A0AAD6X1B8_9AGAR|nr:hypothetical protein C8F04DRAFT_1237420 [Mycena alexandri]